MPRSFFLFLIFYLTKCIRNLTIPQIILSQATQARKTEHQFARFLFLPCMTYSSVLKTGAVRSSKMEVNFYQTTCHHSLEEFTFYRYLSENLKSHFPDKIELRRFCNISDLTSTPLQFVNFRIAAPDPVHNTTIWRTASVEAGRTAFLR
jgi:hypothetical protein